MSKKFLSRVIAWGCLLTVGFTSMPIYANPIVTETESVEVNQEERKIDWLKLSWKALASAVDYFWHPNAKSVSGNISDYVSSGKFAFNSKDTDYAATLSHDIAIASDSVSIELAAQRPLIDFSARIAVSLYDDYHDLVKSKTLEDDEHYTYSLSSPSNGEVWQAAFTTTDKKDWNCWIFENHKNRTRENISEEYEDVIFTEDNFYVKYNSTGAKRSINEEVSMKELIDEVTDPISGYYVYNFTSYNVGDQIKFSDSIYDLKYDADKDSTEVSFIGNNEEIINWIFKGDITVDYSIGDILNLNFTVIEKENIDDYTFETIDYIKEVSNNNIPEITKYLAE